jgi:hypothetical protein
MISSSDSSRTPLNEVADCLMANPHNATPTEHPDLTIPDCPSHGADTHTQHIRCFLHCQQVTLTATIAIFTLIRQHLHVSKSPNLTVQPHSIALLTGSFHREIRRLVMTAAYIIGRCGRKHNLAKSIFYLASFNF